MSNLERVAKIAQLKMAAAMLRTGVEHFDAALAGTPYATGEQQNISRVLMGAMVLCEATLESCDAELRGMVTAMSRDELCNLVVAADQKKNPQR